MRGWPTRTRSIPGDRRRASLEGTYAIVREALEGSVGTRVCRHRALERQPDDRLAGEPRLPRHDSAGRHRRGAPRGAGALVVAPGLHRHGDRQPAGGHRNAVISRPSATSGSSSSQLDTLHRARRDPPFLSPATRDSAGVQAGIHGARRRPADARVQTLPRLPADGVPAGGARRHRRRREPRRRALLRGCSSRASARCRSPAKEVHELGPARGGSARWWR